jgi:hypothetical protein
MAEKDLNYNVTQTFYAKWILPFVVIFIGIGLLLYFAPAMKFMKGKEYDTKVEKVFYKVTINGEDRYVEVKEKYIYEEKNKGSNTYYYNTLTEYDKKIPHYSSVRYNLSGMGTAGGIGLTVVGVLFLFVSTFQALTKVSQKKKNMILDNEDDEEEDEFDEEDDE